MGDVSLNEAIELLRSSKIKDQTEGLIDLKHILSRNRRNPNLDALNDKGYHKLFESLFRIVSTEKSSYVRTSKSTKSSTSSRLSSCASTIRLAVELGVRKIKGKTFRIVVDHILQTLPISSEGYCEPLSLDYVKSLRTLLEYEPHVEHMLPEDWELLTEFCCAGVELYQEQASVQGSSFLNGRATRGSYELADAGVNLRVPSAVQSNIFPTHGDSKIIAEELMLCIEHLVSVSNAPTLDKAELVSATILSFLNSSSSTGRSHQAAFTAINAILVRIVTNNVSLTRTTIAAIIPVIDRLWLSKRTQIKNEMMVSLVLASSYIDTSFFSDATNERKDNLDSLYETLRQEYGKRMERDQLQLDDLGLWNHLEPTHDYSPLRSKTLYVNGSNSRAEQTWILPRAISWFLVVLDRDGRPSSSSADDQAREKASKRRRLSRRFDDTLRRCKTHDHPARIAALQTLSFVFDTKRLSTQELQATLDCILPCITDENSQVASWSMIAIASCAMQRQASSICFADSWVRIWLLSLRCAGSSPTCRAACHLLEILLTLRLVSHDSIAESIENIFSSISLNGPASLVDSSLSFWTLLLRYRAVETPTALSITSERVLQWLLARWSPAKITDRAVATNYSIYAQPMGLLRLLYSCLGKAPPYIGNRIHKTPCGAIARACIKQSQSHRLASYLLLLDEAAPAQPDLDASLIQYTSNHAETANTFHPSSIIVMGFCITEFQKANEAFALQASEKASQVNSGMVRSVTALIIIGSILSSLSPTDSLRYAAMSKAVTSLVEELARFLSSSECEILLVDGALEVVSIFLPDPWVKNKHNVSNGNAGLLELVRALKLSIEGRRLHDPPSKSHDPDYMELDDDFESQSSNTKTGAPASDIPRQNLTLQTSAFAFRHSVTAHINLITGAASTMGSSSIEEYIPNTFIDYLISLKPSELLACSDFLRFLFRPDSDLSRADAARLLVHFSQEIFAQYDYERCEVCLCDILCFMAAFADMWTEPLESDELSEIGSALYNWFTGIALEKIVLPSEVNISVANLLQRLLQVRPEYKADKSMRSVRSCLFFILQKGDISVKFHVSEHIARIFGLFIFHMHDAIFDDILKSLPSQMDWYEGIALRLLMFARLASSWHTLLRRSVYHIFETPGLVQSSTNHAARCYLEVAHALGLKSPKEILKLFAPQLLYTWIGSHEGAIGVTSIPFLVFGYSSLRDLLLDVQDELVSQLLMRSGEEAIKLVADTLQTSIEDLVVRAFDRAIAYSVARDISIPPISDGGSQSSSEARIRKRFRKERYLELLDANFASIISILFQCIEQEEQIERAFAKLPGFEYAATALKLIKKTSSSDVVLPANQQPSFRARYLVEEIDHICRRTSYDIHQIWTPALLSYAFRNLLNMIHPALGSLHTCSILRRVRIMVCLASSTTLEGYPLEMLLHALRPYLTDPQCADDTLGIVQYLFENSKLFLVQDPSFVAGISLSILTSLRAFMSSVQDSTTHESQHLATMSRASAFHTWFGDYLEAYNSPQLVDTSTRAFKVMVSAARNVRSIGNSIRGTSESDLLQELLEDSASGRNLLNTPTQELMFSLLCGEFESPSSFTEDIFGSDGKATSSAVTVWKSCQRHDLGDGYLLWAARVLGRSYASTGQVPRDMLRESPIDEHGYGLWNIRIHPPSSKSLILEVVKELLGSSSSAENGLAEHTFRVLWSRVDSTHDPSDLEQVLGPYLMSSSDWSPYQIPPDRFHRTDYFNVRKLPRHDEDIGVNAWMQQVVLSLVDANLEDAIVGALPQLLLALPHLSWQLFPYVLHINLLHELRGPQLIRTEVSALMKAYFLHCKDAIIPHVKLLIKAILYLRTQPMPQEVTSADRENWLEIDHADAARAAVQCNMFKTALLFIEIHQSRIMSISRRSSFARIEGLDGLLRSIYANIDEPDSFYGVQHEPSLVSIMEKADYEGDGFKSLSFQGAFYDSKTRQLESGAHPNSHGLLNALNTLNLNGLSLSFLQNHINTGVGPDSTDHMYQTARKLEQWDLPAVPIHDNEAAIIFRAFQSINTASDPTALKEDLNATFLEVIRQMKSSVRAKPSLHKSMRTLAVLTEIDESLNLDRSTSLSDVWDRLKLRQVWMPTGRLEDVIQLLSSRETLFSSISKRLVLQNLVRCKTKDARSIEALSVLESSAISRTHGVLQRSLASAAYLSDIVAPCKALGLEITAVAQNEAAKVLWEQGEMAASIRMLQELNSSAALAHQAITVGRPELLAKLGHQISEARMEMPDEIISRYLLPAIKELKGRSTGAEAGRVFHEFASFCDQQLQNPDNVEDFERISKLRQRKESEVSDLQNMLKAAGSQNKGQLQNHKKKAEQWLEIDDREYQRLLKSREAFLRQSLENYLLCLKACEDFNNDVLRFCALWLEQSHNKIANHSVAKYLSDVPSRKFAPLMNQLSSRLLDTEDDFQPLLYSLALRICTDHPFHGMYQVFAGTRTKHARDDMAIARHDAAMRMSNELGTLTSTSTIWKSLVRFCGSYIKLALERLDEKVKAGSKVALRKSNAGQVLEREPQRYRLPPPTMKIDLRSDCNYSKIPVMNKFHTEMTVASGVSAPKIVTVVASDGQTFKQLVKGGSDDLRQDSIMEQVFEQVSGLLQNNRLTRQRELVVRTYKVLPLTTYAGIIEFVPNTIPLHDYLIPAHQHHYPKDWRSSACRKQVADVQQKSIEVRVRTYKEVSQHFHPVMRHFFMERFLGPDDWFEKRLAYSRSTAAISILGHVLGLGDRHGHNILLDEKTGEVVHIDLGVAFEQGRVLPVPEVVPFRLTRDIVDGMGITKTEGVFRRCCEFILDALRKDSYSIMTILDVLRYDPLYNWSVSPVRVKKIQEAQNQVLASEEGSNDGAEAPKRTDVNEAGEADRALTVVAKKLSKGLSVTATVNELIQQATDERNLALLYCGWAAWA